jgi:hypothetical protein
MGLITEAKALESPETEREDTAESYLWGHSREVTGSTAATF